MNIPTLEEELEAIVEDATEVTRWAEHVRQQVTKVLERRKAVEELIADVDDAMKDVDPAASWQAILKRYRAKL